MDRDVAMSDDDNAILYMIDHLTSKWTREVLPAWQIKSMQLNASKGLDAVERVFERELDEDMMYNPKSPVLNEMKKDMESGVRVYRLIS